MDACNERALHRAEMNETNTPTRVADRYDIGELLGRGGMASVYRASDSVSGKTVALKILTLAEPDESPVQDGADSRALRNVELFEREFHTLVHFAHPRVVAAFDYGLDGAHPYYTMELLDGGDLQGLAPMPWGDACVVAYEICSALALLHSRGLVHRDITPRNIRRTADGKAKLIDFGLLSPMGPTGLMAGTPPFVAPELVGTLSLDGRSDLFSLGATLYYALTGRHAFSAKNFDKLRDAWRTNPLAPSVIVPGIPSAVDDLVLGLLRIDAASRPKTAAEVMEQLLPWLSQAPDEELRVASAYLTTPRLVGRGPMVERFRKQMMQALRRKGGGIAVVGEGGTGRSRMLDAFVLEAKLMGATAIRAGTANATGPFGVAASLAAQLHAASPLHSLAAADRDPKSAVLFAVKPGAGAERTLVDVAKLDRTTAHAALRAWILSYSSERPLAVAVDDVDQIDEPSLALLASLTWEAPERRLAYAVSFEPAPETPPEAALGIVQKHAAIAALKPLDAGEVRALLISVFGDVANLGILANRLHAICDGRPRECMALAQFLVDRGIIRYARGSWTVPAEIADGLLPASITDALAHRMESSSALARRLAALLSFCIRGRLSRAELLVLLESEGAAAIDRALDELGELRVIAGDTAGYSLRHGSLARLLTASLAAEEVTALHDRLAHASERTGAHPFITAYHELLGSRPEAGVDRVVASASDSDARIQLIQSASSQLGTANITRALTLGLEVAERAGRPRRDLQIFWVMLAGMCAQGADANLYYRVRPVWLAQLKKDSGWDAWQALDPSLEPAPRAMMAVGAAIQAFGETPESERVLAPPDAIKQLVSYVVFSIAIASRVQDVETMATLPDLLAPFAPLNPMVAAMLDNARGTLWYGEGKREAAHTKFDEVRTQLETMTGVDLGYVDRVRGALAQTLGQIDSSLGIESPWVERLSHPQQDPAQLVGAQYLRKIAALQKGDWEAAERYRQLGELYSLQSNATSMFSTLGQELEAHAMARDLTGLNRVKAGLESMAAQHPGWEPVMHLAEAHHLRLCGETAEALVAIEAAVRAGERGTLRSPWAIEARTLQVEILSEGDRAHEGLDLGLAELTFCEANGMACLARGVSLALALCEAQLGRGEQAMQRIERVIAEQKALGVAGLQLGRAYELGARTAMALGDRQAFQEFAAQAREQYRSGKSSVLGALYERLMDDARRAGIVERVDAPLESGTHVAIGSRDRVTTAMAGCATARERADRALALLCDGEPPSRGHLFLVAENGLTLAASNASSASTDQLADFARGFIAEDREADDSKTTAIDDAAFTSPTGYWRDADGTHYSALLLGAVVRGEFQIGGVALLTGPSARLTEIASLAEAIAKTLFDAGDTRAIRAA